MADDPTKHNDDPQPNNDPKPNDPKPGEDPKPNDDGDLKDKHGESAINRGHHDRMMAEKDAKIAELEKQLEDMGDKAKGAEEAIKKVEALERKLESEKVSHALQSAGCIDEKAAKARLADFEGDVDKLKESCPYLFAAKQPGSTGARHQGTPSPTPSDELVAKAREAAGTTYLYTKKQ